MSLSCALLFLATNAPRATGFVPSSPSSSSRRTAVGDRNGGMVVVVPSSMGGRAGSSSSTSLSFFSFGDDNDREASPKTTTTTTTTTTTESPAVWSPGLRRIIAGAAGFGALETFYLTYAKLTAASPALFCGSSSQTAAAASSCDRVLNGPYSELPGGIPLAALGFLAYSAVAGLALSPLLRQDTGGGRAAAADDTQNRILLTALTTAMGTFSVFLMTLLFGVLRTSCPYCVASAADSFLLANLALIGGCLPEGGGDDDDDLAVAVDDKTRRDGARTVAAGFAGAVVGAVLLFGTGSLGGSAAGGSTLLATTALSGGTPEEMIVYAPPEITTDSSPRALEVAKRLKAMDAKMYGAHWCSHCYDQKQTLGKQVFDKTEGFVEYVECSRDGLNSRTKLCKAKEIPGYPTWEINGKLYPGEVNLEELEDLIRGVSSSSSSP